MRAAHCCPAGASIGGSESELAEFSDGELEACYDEICAALDLPASEFDALTDLLAASQDDTAWRALLTSQLHSFMERMPQQSEAGQGDVDSTSDVYYDSDSDTCPDLAGAPHPQSRAIQQQEACGRGSESCE